MLHSVNNIRQERHINASHKQHPTKISLVKFDIKGFFNSIPRDRLLQHLERLGIPTTLRTWISNFLTDVSARFKVDGFLSEAFDLDNGIPQGSPLSPILSILFTADLLPYVRRYLSLHGHLHNSSKTLEDLFLYVDDGLFIVRTPPEFIKGTHTYTRWDHTPEHVSLVLEALNSWASTFGIEIDKGKTEVLHLFTTKVSFPPPIPGVNVVTTMKWLGVTFDPWLTFNAHVKNRISDCRSFLAPFYRIKENWRGIPPAAAKRFYEGAIRPKLLYASAAWWTTTALSTARLQSFERAVLARVAGCFHTTRGPLLNAILGIPSIENYLAFTVHSYANRIRFLSEGNPLKRYITDALSPPPHILDKSPLALACDSFPPEHRQWTPTTYPPWKPEGRIQTLLAEWDLPPPDVPTQDVLDHLHEITTEGTTVLNVKISHHPDHPALVIYQRRTHTTVRESHSPRYTIALPQHTIGERVWAAVLALAAFLQSEHSAHWLDKPLLLVMTDKSLVTALRFPFGRTMTLSHAHNDAAIALSAWPRQFKILPVDKELFTLLPSPPPELPFPPPTDHLVTLPVSELTFGTSKRVKDTLIRKLHATFHLSILADLPADHIWNDFDLAPSAVPALGAILPALDIYLPTKYFTYLARLASGHIYHGFYAGRFHLSDEDGNPHDTSCPCGYPIQTIHHILKYCLFGDASRHFLHPENHQVSLPGLLTKYPMDVNTFIRETHAFDETRYGIDA